MVAQVRIEDEAGGVPHPEETLAAITDHVIARSVLPFEPDQAVGEWVRGEVLAARHRALAHKDAGEDEFTQEEVEEEMKRCVVHKKCLRGALAVPKAKSQGARRLTWAHMVLVQTMKVAPHLWWLRECAPLRKKEPQIVRSLNLLRPVCYASDLAGLFDALWLRRTRERLEAHSGDTQQGGKFDAAVSVLTLVMAVQARALGQLPTYALFVDLLQGFDVTWRDGIRYGMAQAGITGGMFWYKDDQLARDIIQARFECLVGPRRIVVEGVMQGRRTAPLEFNLFVATQAERVQETIRGLGLTPPDEAVVA